MHPEPSRRKIIWGRVGIVVTVLAWAAYVVTTVLRALINDPTAGFRFRAEAVSYVVVVTFLTFSALMYLLARQGALNRFREHRRVPRGELDRHFADYKDAVTVLVPSYAEEPQVVRATLWSAALQEFPDLSVVLLLDDPPSPTDPDDQERLPSHPRPRGQHHPDPQGAVRALERRERRVQPPGPAKGRPAGTAGADRGVRVRRRLA